MCNFYCIFKKISRKIQHLARQAVNTIIWLMTRCDSTWRHRSGSKLAHAMACCLTARSHYLRHSWLFINGVMWHSIQTSFRGSVQDIISLNAFEIYTRQITSTQLGSIYELTSDVLWKHINCNQNWAWPRSGNLFPTLAIIRIKNYFGIRCVLHQTHVIRYTLCTVSHIEL